MRTRLLLVAVALLALAVGACAQGRGGGMRMGGRMGGAMLLMRPDVQRDLALTDDQKTKLQAIRSEMQEAMQAAREESQGDREAMMQAMQQITRDSQKKANEILTADQQKRLKEIGIQLGGNRVVMQEDVAKDLGLSDEQKAKIRDIINGQEEKRQALREEMMGGGDREQMQQAMQKLNKETEDAIAAVLTEQQKAKLKELAGKPFKADENIGG